MDLITHFYRPSMPVCDRCQELGHVSEIEEREREEEMSEEGSGQLKDMTDLTIKATLLNQDMRGQERSF